MATKYIKRAALAALAFTTLSAGVSRGQSALESLPGEDAPSSWQSETPIPKPCVLLRNDNVLFGQAHQVGQFVVIRDGNSGEFQLPRQEVACWADSIRDLYRYRVDHRSRADVATHLRDAQWCVRYDLYDLAAVEIAAVRTIDPQNYQAGMLASRIARTLSPEPSTVAITQGAEPIRQAAHQNEGPDQVGVDLGGIDLATLRFFAANVQPTLINRCGNCHAHDSGRPWSIIALGVSSRPSSRMTQENLSSALGYINRRSPQNSELLQMAVSPHGGSNAPLDPRHAKSVDALKYWLSMLERDDFPGDDSAPSSSMRQAETPYVAERPAEEAADDEFSEPMDEAGSSRSPVQIVDTPAAPARLPQVRDPFSPDLFNRRHEN